MKKIFKSTLAVALVAAAAFGGVKTYGAYSATSESDLLAENVEALSAGDGIVQHFQCKGTKGTCYVIDLIHIIDGKLSK